MFIGHMPSFHNPPKKEKKKKDDITVRARTHAHTHIRKGRNLSTHGFLMLSNFRLKAFGG